MTRRCTNPECPHGSEPLPWDMFYAVTKWPDGTMRRPQSRCKDCHREAARKSTPTGYGRTMLRKRQRERRRRALKDPEKAAAWRERERLYKRGRPGRGTRPHLWLENRGGLKVPSAVVRAAIEASGVPLANVAAWAAVSDTKARKALQRDEMSAQLATALLDAINVAPAEIGL